MKKLILITLLILASCQQTVKKPTEIYTIKKPVRYQVKSVELDSTYNNVMQLADMFELDLFYCPVIKDGGEDTVANYTVQKQFEVLPYDAFIQNGNTYALYKTKDTYSGQLEGELLIVTDSNGYSRKYIKILIQQQVTHILE